MNNTTHVRLAKNILDIKDDSLTCYPSINLAKKESRKLQGNGAVVRNVEGLTSKEVTDLVEKCETSVF